MGTRAAVTLASYLEHESLRCGESTVTHAVIDLEALARGIEVERPRLSVAFSIDVSGSMQGEPLSQVQDSLIELIDLLDDSDRASLTVFTDSASEVVPLVELNRENRALAKRRIRRIKALQSTNIEDGLKVARATLPEREDHERQVIILLSDGAPNAGESSPQGLSAVATSFRPGVTVTSLGYGAHHNEDVLFSISRGGAGQYFFISDPQECSFELATAIGTQGDVAVDGLELFIQPQDGVEIEEAFVATAPRFSPKGLALSLPNLLERQKRVVVFRIKATAPTTTGAWRPLRLRLEYSVAGSATRDSIESDIEVAVRTSEAVLSAPHHGKVLVARAERQRREARKLADGGNFAGAAALLRKFMAEIEKAAAYVAGDGSPLSETFEQLLDEAVAYETRPDPEFYRNFKRTQLGVDLGSGGRHSSAYQAHNTKGIKLRRELVGNLPKALLSVIGGPTTGDRVVLSAQNEFGRAPDSGYVLDSGSISRRHFRVIGAKGRFVLVDLGSTNGIQHNGKMVNAPIVLSPGDEVGAAPWTFRYEESDDK